MFKQRPEDFVTIATVSGIVATDDVHGRVIMLGFYRKGVVLLLTYDEALALGRVLMKVAQPTTQHLGGESDYRA